MYKITLYDHNCSPICDGTASFFVDKLEDFEKYWLEHECVDEETKNRFLRSKNGEIVTDYYTDDPKYNIVQIDDNATILFEKEYAYDNKVFTLYNVYHCESKVYAKHAAIKLRYVKFNNQYHLIGTYKLTGVCERERRSDVDESDSGWRRCSVWGNPIHIVDTTDSVKLNLWIDENGRRRLDYPKEKFENNTIETYCWVTVGSFSSENDLDKTSLNNLTNDFFAVLMADIPGEAG